LTVSGKRVRRRLSQRAGAAASAYVADGGALDLEEHARPLAQSRHCEHLVQAITSGWRIAEGDIRSSLQWGVKRAFSEGVFAHAFSWAMAPDSHASTTL